MKNHGNKEQKFEIEEDNQIFYVVTFRLIGFLRYGNINETNHKKRIIMVEIFQRFQYLHDFKLQRLKGILNDTLILDNTSDEFEFTRVVLIPYFKIKKKRNVWSVTLLVANQFYDYMFSFQFDDSFIS